MNTCDVECSGSSAGIIRAAHVLPHMLPDVVAAAARDKELC